MEPENNIDPDDAISRVCSACTLPIFSTPFKSRGADYFVHDECGDQLPKELPNHVLHRGKTLFLKEKDSTSSYPFRCDKCKRKCGSMMYECSIHRHNFCEFLLDLLCALQAITILHRSHNHRLTAITASASFVCGACGTQHPGFTRLSYMCKACDYWIHTDCATLPNAITCLHHRHSLFLFFNDLSAVASSVQGNCTCAICGGVFQSVGLYFCAKCGYYAHIKCATSDPHSFNPVLLREANLAGLLHFPMADEHTSVMPYIMENRDVDENQFQIIEGRLFRENLHPHPLISFHDHEDEDTGRVCNACVQLISSSADPFYRCSEYCPDFFLHTGCANLPTQLQHPTHEHALSLFSKAPGSSVSGYFYCKLCYRQSNRFAYLCTTCYCFTIDVVCAMMPPSITHSLHSNSHILYLTGGMRLVSCVGCCTSSPRFFYYKCTNCRHFQLDVRCARLPSSAKHKFDDHILYLTVGDHLPKVQEQICEICEDYIPLKNWCYSCRQCDQWFHCDCVHYSSNLKLGATIRVDCHDCPLTLVSASSVYGYRCDCCQKIFRPSLFFSSLDPNQEPAYECSKCYFRIHDDCAEKCLIKI